MKLANAEMNLQIEFLENQVIVLIMEEPGTFSAAIQERNRSLFCMREKKTIRQKR